jgi:ABC-type uncharacterized transport system permease subunit
MTKEFKPSFVESFLGKHYKWYFILKYKLKIRTISGFDSALFVFGHLLILFGTLTTWWLANNKIIDYNLEQKWIYFLVGELFFSLIFQFAEFDAFNTLEGKHITRMLWPQNYFVSTFFSTYGESLFQNIVKSSILIFLLQFLIFNQIIETNFNLTNFLAAFLLLPFNLVLLYLLEIITSFSAFFIKQVNGVILNFTFLLGLLMGRVFPLDALIPNFWINFFNPASYLFYQPMQVFLGKYSPNEIFWVFVGEIFWCSFIYFLANWIFRMGLKRNESVGL